MEFDIKRCYSAINADEVKIGSKVITAGNLEQLKKNVKDNWGITFLQEINDENFVERFRVGNSPDMAINDFLCYLVSEPEEDIESCRICRFKDSPCLPSDYGIDEQGICKNFVKKEEKLPDCNWGTLEPLNRRVKDLEKCQNEHFYRIETLEKTVEAMAKEIDRLRSDKINIGS